ncbi:MAG: thermonuclease family protein [Gammaproteobacteria bacterium]|nr:thermonuclease family protein [Gammaproteobacteria bacterium]
MKVPSKVPYRYSACKVARIVDGDTCDLWINLGFDTFVKKRIRMWGIDTPESRTRDKDEKILGLAATERLIELLSEGVCDLDSIELGKYGRVLGIIHVGDINVNAEMLKTEGTKEYYGGTR